MLGSDWPVLTVCGVMLGQESAQDLESKGMRLHRKNDNVEKCREGTRAWFTHGPVGDLR